MMILVLSFTACLLGTVGCGAENKMGRLALSGTITLDGQPLDYGSIEFYPEDIQGDSTGVSAGGVVSEDGSYSIPEAKGLPPGKYVARIYSAFEKSETKGPVHLGPGPIVVHKERIPPEFNTQSKQIVEMTVAGPNTFDFNIKTKK